MQKTGFLLISHSLRKKESSKITLEKCVKQQHKNNSFNYIELKEDSLNNAMNSPKEVKGLL